LEESEQFRMNCTFVEM